MALHPDHDPGNFSGFTRFLLEAFQRFRTVAVDNPMSDGSLSGSGSAPQVNAHETGVISGEQLLNQYRLPIVISIPSNVSTTPRTTGADTTEITFSVSAYVSDFDGPYGLIQAEIIMGEIINAVENNRRMADPGGDGRPLASDCRFDNLQADFRLNVTPQAHLKFVTADFHMETKRRLPR